jgi:polygalacturonase
MGMNQSLIFAEGCERVGIRGKGLIDGRGTRDNFPGEVSPGPTPGRPFLIRMLDCRQVVIQDIHLKDSPCWMQNYLNCEDLIIDGIHVENQANHNNDGVDIDGCRRVIVRNSFISSGDDGLCFKGASQRPTEQVLVENCRLYSSCNALKFGTDSQGDFRNVLVRHVEVGGPADSMRAFMRRKADGGISWESVDGGTVERVLVQDVHVVRSESPLFLRLGDRGRVRPEQPRPRPGRVRQLVFERISGDDNGKRGSFFTGIPDHPIEDVRISNVRHHMVGGLTPGDAVADPPENVNAYPEPTMFGTLPAYGFFIRHARGVTLDNVEVRYEQTDTRPAFVVRGVSDVDFHHVRADQAPGTPTFVLDSVDGFGVSTSRPVADTRLDHVDHREL